MININMTKTNKKAHKNKNYITYYNYSKKRYYFNYYLILKKNVLKNE